MTMTMAKDKVKMKNRKRILVFTALTHICRPYTRQVDKQAEGQTERHAACERLN
jgi:hypothetical protein